MWMRRRVSCLVCMLLALAAFRGSPVWVLIKKIERQSVASRIAQVEVGLYYEVIVMNVAKLLFLKCKYVVLRWAM